MTAAAGSASFLRVGHDSFDYRRAIRASDKNGHGHASDADRKILTVRSARAFRGADRNLLIAPLHSTSLDCLRVDLKEVIVNQLIALLIVTAGLESAAKHKEATYEIRPLASLGGTSSRGNGVNDSGHVTGFSNLTGNTARRATVWFHHRTLRLDPLGGTNSSVPWSGKSNSGMVVGITQTSQLQTRTDGWSCRIFFPGPDNAKYTCVGFVWEGGRMRPLPTLGGHNGFAASANNRRQVVGWAETGVADPTCIDPTQSGFHAVLWDLSRKKTVDLPPFGDDSAGAATAISERGHVVGISGDCDQSVGRRSHGTRCSGRMGR